MPYILYGCENLPLTLRQEHRLKVFTIKVLRISGSKTEEVTEEERKLHTEEFHKLYSSRNITGEIKSRRRMHMW